MVDNAKIQMTPVQQPKSFRRVKCKVLPTVKVRMKADGARGQVMIINEDDFNDGIHTRVTGRVPLKQAKKEAAGEGSGEAVE